MTKVPEGYKLIITKHQTHLIDIHDMGEPVSTVIGDHNLRGLRGARVYTLPSGEQVIATEYKGEAE